MKIHIMTAEADSSKTGDLEKVITFAEGTCLFANLVDADYKLEIGNERCVYLFGDIFYNSMSDGADIRLVGHDDKAYLCELFSSGQLESVVASLEGQYIGLVVDNFKKDVSIFSDRYSRLDSFYAVSGANFFFASDLEFIFQHVSPEYDQQMLVHMFSVYGLYTPKGLTIYRNVRQLLVGEILTLDGLKVCKELIPFTPSKIENYTEDHLERYDQILRDSIVARAAKSGETWVSSSSGWDSSIVLGLLVDELGPEKVRMITGRLKYSKETEVINKFEIDKVQRIGGFYGIEPKIVDFDFESKQSSSYWQDILPYYKSKHNYTLASFNFNKLSDGLADAAGEGAVIFSGEKSDSFHNFGFAQFATFFHTYKSFTEYADKMNCYLFGPSFFKKVLDGSYTKDKVYEIFRKMNPNVEFASSSTSRQETIRDFLFPLFYGGPRIPFAMTWKNSLFTADAQLGLRDFPYSSYMPAVLTDMSEENIYSWYIHLYHHFHCQGSTVNMHKLAMEANNHHWRMPFDDSRMIALLSKAPEKWGRGLDFNHTKYPLKWVAKNKIKFPYELLDEGPHSYLYDVIEGFSLLAEVTYRSGMTDFFKETISKRAYKQLLSEEYFDLDYLDRLVDDYLDGREASGIDLTNVTSLIILSVVGWY